MLRTEAEERRSQIQSLDYFYSLTLPRGDHWSGQALITIVTYAACQTWVDSKVQLIQVTVNGVPVQQADNDRVWVSLQQGANEIKLDYWNSYNTQSSGGLQAYSTGDELYLFSQLIFSVSQVFPCFDQPDLKGKMKLQVLIQKEWEAASNGQIESEVILQELKQVTFSVTPELPPYLWTINCGDFAVVSSHEVQGIRVLQRQGLQPQSSLLSLLQQGLQFYSWLFDFEYPFQKLDLVLCPNLCFSGMESAACIVVSETSISLDLDYVQTLTLLMHEVSHMWFGDLVTMKWWSDIWLNESFATLISYVACDPSLDFNSEFWMHFNREVVKAVIDDQLPTTHCIEAPCDSSSQAESLIDGITYGKGAAFIRQLMVLIGFEKFKAGCQRYFKRFCWGNCQMIDFVSCLQEESDTDLIHLCRQWVQSKGISIYKVEGNYIEESFHTFAENISRQQLVEVMVVQKGVASVVQVQLGGKVNLRGSWDAVLLNSNLIGYGLFQLDSTSKAYFIDNLHNIQQFNNAQIVSLLSQLFRNINDLSSVFMNLPVLNWDILSWVDYTMTQTIKNTSVAHFSWINKIVCDYFKMCVWQGQKVKQFFAHYCYDDANCLVGLSWIKEGLELHTHFSLAKKICASTLPQSDLLFAQQSVRDRVQQSHAYQCVEFVLTHSDNNPSVKQKLWADITNPDNSDLIATYHSKCDAYWQPHQSSCQQAFDLWFKELPTLARTLPRSKINKFCDLCPLRHNQKDIEQLEMMQESATGWLSDFLAVQLHKIRHCN